VGLIDLGTFETIGEHIGEVHIYQTRARDGHEWETIKTHYLSLCDEHYRLAIEGGFENVERTD
jgi:hypothetical protein